MLFSSPIFLFLYLPLFLIVYYLLPAPKRTLDGHRSMAWKNAFLFGASLVFYAWGEGPVVAVLLLSAGINFVAGRLIEGGQRRAGLWLSLVGSLSLLFYYKYSNFAVDTARGLTETLGLSVADSLQLATIALPIGISFYTFQGISYTLDIYWGRIQANKSFINYGTYVAMFPHQIAGPIVRYADIAPELAERHVTVEKFGIGAERFIIGLAKKVLLANQFAALADGIFNANLTDINPATAWLGIVGYSLQIYFDFSGYSDMAIGLGKMVGFDFKENFNYPYIARSVQDFWRRWHISLSSWFRDYVYIPLGGNRGSEAKTYRNLLIVFFVTGLWHGASLNFIVWGLFHGLFLLVERAAGPTSRLGRWLERVPAVVGHAYTLLVVLVGWVFFRAVDLSSAVAYLGKMVGLGAQAETVAYPPSFFLNTEVMVAIGLGFVLATPVYHRFQQFWQRLPATGPRELAYSLVLFGLFVMAVMYLAADTYNPFIYFRF